MPSPAGKHSDTTQRIIVAIVVFCLPIMAMVYLLVIQKHGLIDFTRKEMTGIAYLRSATKSLSTLTHADCDGRNIQTVLHFMNDISSQNLDQLNISDALNNLSTTINKDPNTCSNELMAGMEKLIVAISDNSNITLDPDMDSYYLGDMIVDKSSKSLSEIKDLLGLFTENTIAIDPHDLRFAHLGTGKSLALLQEDFQKVIAANKDGSARKQLLDYARAVDDAAVELLNNASDTNKVTTHRAAEKLVAAIDVLNAHALDELQHMLDNRIQSYNHEIAIDLVIALLFIFCGIVASFISVQSILQSLKERDKFEADLILSDQTNKEILSHLQELVNEQTHDLLLQKERAEAANLAKSEFLSNISHELRTPMHAILSYAKMGLDRLDSDNSEKLNKYLTNIHISGQRLLKLINTLLDLSKTEFGKMVYAIKPHNILHSFDMAMNGMQSLLQEKEITIEINKTTDNLSASFDEERLVQVFVNLLSNAIKFSPHGSVLRASFSETTLPTSIDALLFKLHDRGPGVPFNELQTIFDKFVQSSATKSGAGGTGLGLSISQMIVTAHDGQIWAENDPSGGAVFCIAIPRHLHNNKQSSDRGEL